MAKLMTVQDWIPEHPYPEPIFLLTPFIPRINSLSKVVHQKQRESVCGASGEMWVIAKRAKFKPNLTLGPTSQSEAIKNSSTKQKNKLKKKKEVHILGRGREANKPYKPHTQVQWTSITTSKGNASQPEPRWRETQDQFKTLSQASAMERTLITLTANKEEIMSAKKKKKRH